MKEWLREYAAGAGWELYRVAMSPFFEGTSFSRSHARLLRFCHVERYFFLCSVPSNVLRSAANIIFSEIGVIVFAIDIIKGGAPVAVPFPANYLIPSDHPPCPYNHYFLTVDTFHYS